MEEKVGYAFNDLVEYIMLHSGIIIDGSDAKQCMLLHRGIEYADIYNYTHTPKSIEDKINNSIFFVKASCYYQRKLIEFKVDGQEQFRWLQEYEHRTVFGLKIKLPPTPLQLNKLKQIKP